MIEKRIKIEYIDTNLIKAYKNNPRQNKNAVASVAKSIEKYGFKNPIVIDKDNVVICGHTRLKAARQLGLKTVPTIKADDLTPRQIKEFRIIDNKVGESATWDIEKLKLELPKDLKIQGFDFDWGIKQKILNPTLGPDYYGRERERTAEKYNLNEYIPDKAKGYYDIPQILPCDYVPDNLIGFNYVLSTKDKNAGVHFFIDDYQFERIWNEPKTYIEKLKEFQCVLTPDFSLYMDMPTAMKIWNVYRSRQIGSMCQEAGLKVIPTLQWADEKSFDYCFDGLPENSTVAVSTVGVMKNKEWQDSWKKGMSEAIKRLHPKKILLYGADIDFDFGDIEVKRFKNKVFDR